MPTVQEWRDVRECESATEKIGNVSRKRWRRKWMDRMCLHRRAVHWLQMELSSTIGSSQRKLLLHDHLDGLV